MGKYFGRIMRETIGNIAEVREGFIELFEVLGIVFVDIVDGFVKIIIFLTLPLWIIPYSLITRARKKQEVDDGDDFDKYTSETR